MANAAAATTTPTVLTALFRDMTQAEQAYGYAIELGYEPSTINVLMSEQTRERYLATARADTPLAEKAAEPAPESSTSAEKLGGPAGGTMGTVAPAIAAVGAALLVPGLGLAVAGPIAIALTAAGAVGVATGVIGALTNWGIPKDRAEQYHNSIRKGGIVIGVTTKSDADTQELSRRWRAVGGEMISA
jgi:hypothetical protein